MIPPAPAHRGGKSTYESLKLTSFILIICTLPEIVGRNPFTLSAFCADNGISRNVLCSSYCIASANVTPSL